MACAHDECSPESRMERAVKALVGGGCVVYPTETFYALGALVGSPSALARVNTIKGRPRSKPLPVILGSRGQLAQVISAEADAWPGYATALHLMDAFWPGPLSIIMPAAKGLPAPLLDGRGSVSVRFTPHPQAQELCLRCGSPLAATSANVSGEPAVNDMGRLSPAVCLGADFVLPGDPSPAGGLASTVVRPLANGEAYVYRVGALSLDRLEAAGVILKDEA